MGGYHNILLQSSSPGRRENKLFSCTVSGVFQPSYSDLTAQPHPEVTCYCLWASEVQPNEMYLNTFRYFLADFWLKFCLTVSEFESRDPSSFSQNYFLSFGRWRDLHSEMINCQDYNALCLKPCSPLVILICWEFQVGEKYQLRECQTQPWLHFIFFHTFCYHDANPRDGFLQQAEQIAGAVCSPQSGVKNAADSLLDLESNKISPLFQSPSLKTVAISEASRIIVGDACSGSEARTRAQRGSRPGRSWGLRIPRSSAMPAPARCSAFWTHLWNSRVS